MMKTYFQMYYSYFILATRCTSERSFSFLIRLKNYFRSTKTENRLNGLAMTSIHREELLSLEEIIE